MNANESVKKVVAQKSGIQNLKLCNWKAVNTGDEEINNKTDHWSLNVCGVKEEPAKEMEDWWWDRKASRK